MDKKKAPTERYCFSIRYFKLTLLYSVFLRLSRKELERKMVQKINKREMKKLETKLLKLSEKLPDSEKFLFRKRYRLFVGHLKILENLEESLFKNDGAIIEKEYVKGRPSITINPAVSQYNATSKQLDSIISSIEKQLEKVREEDTDIMSGILQKMHQKTKE